MDKAKHKIVYIHHEANMAGSAISLYQLISSIDRSIYYPILILPLKGESYHFFNQLGIEIIICPFIAFYTFPGPKTFSFGFIKQLKALLPNIRLRNLIKKISPDLVHINDKAGVQAGISLLGLKIKIIQHIRSSFVVTKSKINILLNSALIKLYADYLVIISEDEEDEFENFYPKQIIYNAVDIERSVNAISNRNVLRKKLNINSNDIVIGFAAAQNKMKGFLDFLEITSNVSMNFTNLKFLILGKKNESFKTFISPTLQDKLIYTGYTTLNIEHIACMDILLVPNLNKVLGRQPIESQSVKVPVIAYIGNKPNSIIKNNQTGFLCKTKDEMIRIIKNIITLPDEYNRVKDNCLDYAKHNFDKNKMVKKIENIYQNLINKTND